MKSERSTTIEGEAKLTLRVLSVQNNNAVIWKTGRRTIVNADHVRVYHQKKSAEGVVGVDSSVSSRSEYQSNSWEFSRPRLDRSQGLRSSESSENRVEKRKKTRVAGNKSGKREQWLRKRKRTRGSNESSTGSKQPVYNKRPPEVRRCKRGVPSLLEENQDKKRRPHNRNNHKRRLPSSISSNQQVKKRNKRTEENNEQVLDRGSRPSLAEERPLQSSRIQPGWSNPYNLRNRGEKTRKTGSRSSEKTVQAKEGPVRSRRSSP
ncbi:hypothetical protein TNCV_3203721 [Trichonephila clavipes]|nr:hypothetical protein TNCV_3203721 [Trichonephila clavipes]